MRQRIVGVGLILVALCGADVDFVFQRAPFAGALQHGTITHSFGAAGVFAGAFALAGRTLAGWRRPMGQLVLVGLACYGGHVILDWATYGRGVAIFWPFSDARWQAPMPLFFGLHHSQPGAWHLHAITLATELPIALGIMGLGWLLYRRRAAALPTAQPARAESPTRHAAQDTDAAQTTPGTSHDGAIVDAHVHLHSGHDLAAVFDIAAKHFDAHRRRYRLPTTAAGYLMLAESAGEQQFNRLALNAAPLGDYRVERLAEPIALRLSKASQPPLYVIAGRQIVTDEKLEVLALGMGEPIDDGQPIDAVIDQVVAAGALPVIPWGLGKWWGRRGRIVRRMLRQRGAQIALGDNGGRWWGLPASPLFGAAKQAGVPVLAGSDPLPLPWETEKVARYGNFLDGPIDPMRPFASLLAILRDRPAPSRTLGRLESLPTMFRSQLAWRRVKPTTLKPTEATP